MALHSEYTGANLHMPNVTQEADPGAIGAHKTWLVPSTGILRRRTAADDGWTLISRDPTVLSETTATYTISIADWMALVRLTDGSGVTVTVPADATDDLPIGITVWIEQSGAGSITVQAEGAQPTIHAPHGLTATNAVGQVAVLRKVGADEWVLGSGPRPHALGGSEHTADTLANLNAKVSDATLDDVSATRDPNAHSHGKADLPSAVAYEDEANTFTLDQSFGANVDMTALPTTDPAVAGRLWNDAGTLKVSAG